MSRRIPFLGRERQTPSIEDVARSMTNAREKVNAWIDSLDDPAIATFATLGAVGHIGNELDALAKAAHRLIHVLNAAIEARETA